MIYLISSETFKFFQIVRKITTRNCVIADTHRLHFQKVSIPHSKESNDLLWGRNNVIINITFENQSSLQCSQRRPMLMLSGTSFHSTHPSWCSREMTYRVRLATFSPLFVSFCHVFNLQEQHFKFSRFLKRFTRQINMLYQNP